MTRLLGTRVVAGELGGTSNLAHYRSENSFVGVTSGNQRRKKLRDVIGTSRLHGDVNCGIAKIDSVISAVIGGFNDVGAMIGQDTGEPVQGAGIVGQVNAQAHEASIFHQTAFDNAREKGDVNLPATDENSDSFAPQR